MAIKKILILLGQSQYDVLPRFSYEIGRGFEKLGVDVSYLDLINDLDSTPTSFLNGFDMIFSFNSTESTLFTCNKITNYNTLFWSFYVDHPFYHSKRLLSAKRNSIVSFVDQAHLAYAKEMYPNNPYAFFIPHAGELCQTSIPFYDKEYDICLFGTYSNPEFLLEPISGFSEALQSIIITIISNMLKDQSLSLENLLAIELGKRGIQLSKESFRNLVSSITFIDEYVRNKKRHDAIEILLHAGIKVDVFGNGWEDFESKDINNLCIHKALDYESILKTMTNSKIILNVAPSLAHGSHERVFTAMGMKSIVITDDNYYFPNIFEDQKHIFYYSYNELDKLPSLVNSILSRDIDVENIISEAYDIVSTNHLWYNRAEEILNIANSLLLSDREIISIFTNTDYQMNQLLNHIERYDYKILLEKIKSNYLSLEEDILYSLMKSFSLYNFWGKFNPIDEEFEVLEQRTDLLKNNTSSFIWLYERLEDNWSKEILISILLNWENPNLSSLNHLLMGRRYSHYFDYDIIQTTEDEVFVDLGAYIGDTLDDFLIMSNHQFKKVYCYECDPNNVAELSKKISLLGDSRIIMRNKAVGQSNGYVFMSENDIDHSNSRITSESESVNTEMVCLDDDISEKITFIKSDIEGYEYKAILGAKNHIINEHPKLALSVYNGNYDITKIAELIYSLDPSYKFYLRYYGGNLYPNEIVLYAI